ncbi:MAG: ABC transporter substrate-binding protein [Spirochaetaceae bacterium]
MPRNAHVPLLRRVLVGCVLALALFALGATTAAAQTGDGGSGTEVTVEFLRGPTGMGGIRLIDEEPGFADTDVVYRLSGSPENTVARVLSGEVDIAALPSNLAAKVYNAGAPYQLAVVHTLGVLYLVSRDESVADWPDLRGREIGNAGRGANPDIIFRYLLRRNGLDPDEDVGLRFYNHTELAQLLIAGRRDVAVLPEPFVTRVLTAAPEVQVVMDFQEEWRELKGENAEIGMGALVVKRSLVESNPEFLRSFLRAYRESIRFVNDRPAAAGELIEKHELGFTAEDAASAIPRANIVFRPAPDARRALEEYLQVLLDFDPASVGGSLPDDGFYLDRALP